MSKFHGKDAFFSLEDSAGTTPRIITDFDSIEIDQSTGMADSTTIGLEAKTFLPGLTEGSISLSGKFDDAATTGEDVVLSGNLGNDVSVAFVFGPSGNTTGTVKYSGECYVSKYQVSAPLEGVVKFTASLQVTGAITRGVF